MMAIEKEKEITQHIIEISELVAGLAFEQDDVMTFVQGYICALQNVGEINQEQFDSIMREFADPNTGCDKGRHPA